jgi:hypothetical protein
LNVQRLKEYKERLVVFPRRNNKVKNGDATKAEIAASTLDTTSVNTLPKAADAVTFAPMTEVRPSLLLNPLFLQVMPCYDLSGAITDNKNCRHFTYTGAQEFQGLQLTQSRARRFSPRRHPCQEAEGRQRGCPSSSSPGISRCYISFDAMNFNTTRLLLRTLLSN